MPKKDFIKTMFSLISKSILESINIIVTKLKNFHPAKPLALLFFFIPIFIAILRTLVLDNDFWFLSNTGKYILNHGFPVIEPFTIHQNFSFIIQQWLTDIIFYVTHLYFGGWGIVILVILKFLILFFLTYKLCMLVSEKRFYLSIILTSIIGLLLSSVFLRSRPQIFDFLILTTLLYFLESYIRKKDNKYLYPLPLLSLLLINLHASSWLMLFMFMLPYLINSFKFKFLCFESEGYKKKPLFIILIIMILMGFINPYGIKSITYLFTSYGNFYINALVNEMQVPKITTSFGFTIYLSIFAVLFCYINNKKEHIKIRYFLLMIGTIFLSLSSVKGYSFFIIASIFSLGDYLKDNFKIYKEQYHYSKDFKIKYSLIVLILLLIIIVTALVQAPDYTRTNTSSLIDYLDFKKVDKKTTKIYTDYDSGGYTEYRGYKTYIDPRAEVFSIENNHQKDIIKEFYELQNGKLDYHKFLESYNFDYLIVSKGDYLYKYYLTTDKNTSYKKIINQKSTFTTYYLYQKIN